jgi:hypothetical protein
MLNICKYITFNFNAIFFANFWHYYTFSHGHASCHKKIVDFNLLALLLYILSTSVREMSAHTFLIHVHTSSFIMH